ncbi:MAG TPA: PQQ-dependent sugar dehydrogenase [Thermoanaerobaculia bacterium]|nr:PQQ-dependent sugar dehydrogenase [Thermoanaerobaculia bacterium]
MRRLHSPGRPLRPARLPAARAASRAAAVLFAVVLLTAVAAVPASGQGLALDLVERATDLTLPVAMASPPDGSGWVFVVQQTGEIVIWDGSGVLAQPFLDLSGKVVCCGERGLLGLAFHPDYATNRELFVHFTRVEDGQLQTVVARYLAVDGDPDTADPASEEILLVVDQPASNHNGGQLAFGPDGHLYVATGDGGGGGDPGENAQDLGTLLGKILRLDVDDQDPGLAYAVPPDNPFVGQAGARDEIWAYGLRNPWRFSFDRQLGDLWIGDVGQNAWEEIDHQPAASSGGENYGWDCREGAHPYADPNGDGNADCPAGGFTDPVLEYAQGGGRCSVTGGFRYRGTAEPRLHGVYLYADFCTGEIFGTVPSCGGPLDSRKLYDAPFNLTAFGEDETGELYVTEYRGGSPAPATSKTHLLTLAPGSGGPDLAVTPDPLDLGEVEEGATVRAVLTLTNANSGPEAVTVRSRALTDARFELDPRAGSAPCGTFTPCLAPGASCTLGVTFRSPTTGPVVAGLELAGNFLPASVALEADVVPCPTTLHLTLSGHTVSDQELHRACDTITTGPDLTVAAGGDLALCAGTAVRLGDGTRVVGGGQLSVGFGC